MCYNVVIVPCKGDLDGYLSCLESYALESLYEEQEYEIDEEESIRIFIKFFKTRGAKTKTKMVKFVNKIIESSDASERLGFGEDLTIFGQFLVGAMIQLEN